MEISSIQNQTKQTYIWEKKQKVHNKIFEWLTNILKNNNNNRTTREEKIKTKKQEYHNRLIYINCSNDPPSFTMHGELILRRVFYVGVMVSKAFFILLFLPEELL